MARAKTPQGEKLKDVKISTRMKATLYSTAMGRRSTPTYTFTDWAAI